MSVAVAMGGSPCKSMTFSSVVAKDTTHVLGMSSTIGDLFLAEDVLPGGVADRLVLGAAERGNVTLRPGPLADPGRPVSPPRALVLGGAAEPRLAVGGVG